MRAGAARGVAILGAILGWAALLLQFWLLLALTGAFGAALWRFLGYFTLIGNSFAAITLTLAALGRGSARRELAMVSAMILIGVTYSLLLRQLWAPQGWQKLADIALHDLLPLLAVLFWLLRPHRLLAWRDAGFALILPLGFVLYALLRGGWEGWYPYPFLDAAALGAGAVALNTLAMGAGFFLLALLLVRLDRKLP